uniref:molybdopterin-dependent oxidoreductase n=1 Tax=Rhodohalobacter sp. TaxID=1974210 RepID=UPI003566E06D
WTRDNLVLRITPRYNESVNDHWMPDEGREAYRQFNENRISKPLQKLDEGQTKSSWNNAFATVTEQLEDVSKDDVLLIGSSHASVEENYMLSKFASILGYNAPVFCSHIEDGKGDGFLLTDDVAPNANGCRLLGFDEVTGDELSKSASSAKVILLLNDHVVDRGVIDKDHLNNSFVINFATNHTETTKIADLVIPITCVAEHAASYVNIDGRIQRTHPAKETKYTNRRLDFEMNEGRLDRYGTNFDNWVTEENKVDCLPFWIVINKISEEMGLDDFTYQSGREIMDEISSSVTPFGGVSYAKMDEESGIVIQKEKQTV